MQDIVKPVALPVENATIIGPEDNNIPSGSHRIKKVDPKELQKEALMKNAMKILGTPGDSYQIFGDYIADQLRTMAEKKQKRLKLLIQKAVILVEEEPEN